MIPNLGNTMEARIKKIQEVFSRQLEELKNKQTMMNNTKIEMKNTLEGINSRITEVEERISELEDRMVEITAKEQFFFIKTKKKEWKELRTVSETSRTTLNTPTFEL